MTSRPVTISTVCYELPDPAANWPAITKAGQLEKARRMMGLAAERKSDLVVFPELFATKHTGMGTAESAETVPDGEICGVLSEAAKTWKMYVAGCLYEQRSEGIYNSLVLFDRMGQLVGSYQKVHLAPGEEASVLPGGTYPVFETDFGRIGAQICYDLNYPEASRCLAIQGAEIILWPTMFSGPREHYTDILMRARAIENQVWLVAANYAQRCADGAGVHIGRSAIVDWDGQVLAETGRREGVATATVDLAEPKTTYGSPKPLLSDRRPDTYGSLLDKSSG